MKQLVIILMAVLTLALTASGAVGAGPAPVDGGVAAGPQVIPAVQTIMAENFEGNWPALGSKWSVRDVSNDGFQRFWGRDDFKPHGGLWSVWPASGGDNAVDPATNSYPDNLDTQMIYGPFDLSDALSAQVEFWMWLETEVDYGDSAYFGVSRDGNIFDEIARWEGDLDWTLVTMDLAVYRGDASVWVRWDFYSDLSVGLGGAFVDDIAIRKDVLAPPAVAASREGSAVSLGWASVPNALQYEVWRAANTPYFTPGSNCAAAPNCAIVSAAPYTHAGAIGNAADNYSYVVLSVNGGVRSFPSNRTGEFDFSLTKGG